MSLQRACDICHFYRQHPDGSPAVHRYGLSRQIAHETKKRPNGHPAFKQVKGFGSLDLCDQCIERYAGRNRRPELVGKTGPKAVA